MRLYAQNVSPSLISPIPPRRKTPTSSLCASSKGSRLPLPRLFSVSKSNVNSNGQFWRRNRRDARFSALDELNLVSFKLNLEVEEHIQWQHGWSRMIFLARSGWNAEVESTGAESRRKRKIVEHLFLLKANEHITEDDEKDMLDYLYTSQYQMRGIIAISLGRIMNENADGITHAVYMRFQTKEDLAKFYDNVYFKLLKEHVMPYCHGWINLDYESEVEDDILPIFRKGEDFNYGVEFLLLISASGDAIGAPVEDAFVTFARLTDDFSSLIVQATQGSNFNHSEKEYTHAAVIRFSSVEELETFKNSAEYKDVWRSKFRPITEKVLTVHFSVDPVGSEIM